MIHINEKKPWQRVFLETGSKEIGKDLSCLIWVVSAFIADAETRARQETRINIYRWRERIIDRNEATAVLEQTRAEGRHEGIKIAREEVLCSDTKYIDEEQRSVWNECKKINLDAIDAALKKYPYEKR